MYKKWMSTISASLSGSVETSPQNRPKRRKRLWAMSRCHRKWRHYTNFAGWRCRRKWRRCKEFGFKTVGWRHIFGGNAFVKICKLWRHRPSLETKLFERYNFKNGSSHGFSREAISRTDFLERYFDLQDFSKGFLEETYVAAGRQACWKLRFLNKKRRRADTIFASLSTSGHSCWRLPPFLQSA